MSAASRDWSWEELHVGQTCEVEHVLSRNHYEHFLGISGDVSPIHADVEAAKRYGFRGMITHGGMLAGYVSHMVGMHLPGKRAMSLSTELRYLKPCYLEDRVVLVAEISQKVEANRVIVLTLRFFRLPERELVATGRAMAKILREPDS
jgi:3-hydroxybutyryl-CoA dehydratase